MATLIQVEHGMEDILSQLHMLKQMLNDMNTIYFDIDDKKVMAAKITNLKLEYTRLNNVKKQKMEIIIHSRAKILRQPATTAVFNKFPDILQFFATKQNTLQSKLDDAKHDNCL
jgi:hypothetical protein